MSTTIDLPIPHDFAKRDDEIRSQAALLIKDSIVTQALERFLIQVLTEVHESSIRPLREAANAARAEANHVEAGLLAKLRAAPVEAPHPVADAKMMVLIERLLRCADDPMWADHAEIPKSWCRQAASAISSLTEQLAEVTRERDKLATEAELLVRLPPERNAK